MNKNIVLASDNLGKIAEFKALFAAHDITVTPQSALGIHPCEEPYFSFIENALHKARHASKMTGLPALADDSGLCVDALNGAPGVFSARYAGEPSNAAANNEKLLANMAHQPKKSAYFVCVLVFIRHELDPQPLIAQGTFYGEVATHACGTGGFGYDPVIFLPEQNCHVAELSPALKNSISHRAQALHTLLQQMQTASLLA
ncbi:MAG: RdgB/HAM1 family non-canonical purine NTP pyrophosphatase [Neisseriaceae bacterium]|nr:RdgB/HAM1 family non-canonical purine NTP pyrophosphatase [Neisseriaceae bacterium]